MYVTKHDSARELHKAPSWLCKCHGISKHSRISWVFRIASTSSGTLVHCCYNGMTVGAWKKKCQNIGKRYPWMIDCSSYALRVYMFSLLWHSCLWSLRIDEQKSARCMLGLSHGRVQRRRENSQEMTSCACSLWGRDYTHLFFFSYARDRILFCI